MLVEGAMAVAKPAGITIREAWDALREKLLADLRAALPLDCVLLGLHGAMVTDGCDDCKGEMLRAVREIVGPGVVIGAELDPHCHLSEAMVRHADLLIAYKDYPHTDYTERAIELIDLCAATVRGELPPQAAVVDTGMTLVMHTTREPGRGLVERMQALEGCDGVLSGSLAHGFEWGDVPEALDVALAEPGPAVGRRAVVMADMSDNPGGGAAGDATFILRRVRERGLTGVAMALSRRRSSTSTRRARSAPGWTRCPTAGSEDPSSPSMQMRRLTPESSVVPKRRCQ